MKGQKWVVLYPYFLASGLSGWLELQLSACLPVRQVPNEALPCNFQSIGRDHSSWYPWTFLHQEQSPGGYEYILVIVDHFTQFAHAYPTRNKWARTIADRFYNDFMLCFGFHARILPNQGREFENKLFHELRQLCGMARSPTTPYHPQGNGKAERFN